MNEEIKAYLNQYPDEIRELYIKLRAMIYDSVSHEVEEKLWAKTAESLCERGANKHV